MGNTYKGLIVWQKGMDLVCEIYRVSRDFPKEERYGLTAQLCRAAVSIPSNIAEGRMRGGEKEWWRFLSIALGSAAELETQITIATRLNYLSESDTEPLLMQLTEIMKILNKLLHLPPKTTLTTKSLPQGQAA